MEKAERAVAATVRTATAADAAAMGGIAGRSWEATYRGMVPDPVLDEWILTAADGWAEAFRAWPPEHPSRVWIAARGTRPIGYATTSPGRDKWAPPPAGSGELTNLYLDPDAIGTGVGRLLYERAIEDLAARGFDPLVVWAFRDNQRARGFYSRMGLVVDIDDAAWVLDGVACPIVRYIRSLRPQGVE